MKKKLLETRKYMKITQLKIQNFKGFNGDNTFNISSGLVFLVGENNTGKTTILEAINFLKSGLPDKKKIDDFKNKQAKETDFVSVEAKIQGNITNVITDFSEEKYKKYVFDENGVETIRISRSSEKRSVTQEKGKVVELNEKKITLWNSESNQFENASGPDTVIGTLLETQFVWSDIDPNDVTDFGSTKICGKLLNSVVGDFYNTPKWQSFVDSHRATFHDGEDSLSKKSEVLEQEIQKVLSLQYGDAKVKFDFNLPEAKAFFTSTSIKVNDGTETDLKDKGSGMQRAFALAVIQIYAKFITKHESDTTKQKPLFFFIDEPEISLHPKAQKILMEALKAISKDQQIFVATHSPYILREFSPSQHNIYIFNKANNKITFKQSTDFKLFKFSPSWGEINYFAYDLPTIEFHNELYGVLQEQEMKYSLIEIDNFFETNGVVKDKDWTEVDKKTGSPKIPYKITLMTFIRNTIHHPENKENSNFTDTELRESIEKMITLINK
jgi:putative ATP-dependent endonuclease of OLD family